MVTSHYCGLAVIVTQQVLTENPVAPFGKSQYEVFTVGALKEENFH
jgi:hypothetical protein